MSELLKETLLDTSALVDKAITKWKAENPPEVIEKDVMDRLDKAKEEIVFKLLGFDNRWGKKWELDHCNGRSGNSPIGYEIKDAQHKAIDKWLNSLDLTALVDAEVGKACGKSLMENAGKNLSYHVREQVEAKLLLAVNAKVTEVMDSLNVSEVLQAQCDIQELLEGK